MWDYDIYVSEVDQMITTKPEQKTMNVEKPRHKETIKTVKQTEAIEEKKDEQEESLSAAVTVIENEEASNQDVAMNTEDVVEEEKQQEQIELKPVSKRGKKSKRKS